MQSSKYENLSFMVAHANEIHIKEKQESHQKFFSALDIYITV